MSTKYMSIYTVLLALAGCFQLAQAESFMNAWLSRQQAMMFSAGTFNADDWLTRQKASTQDEWLANQAASQGATSAFDSDAWLARQAESSNDAVTPSQSDWAPASSWEVDDLEQTLLPDLEKHYGKEYRLEIEKNIEISEKKMQPMFQALPKNEYGKLGHSLVRYMLHRFFVQQHGWFVDGLFTEGAAFNSSSPSRALKGRVPMFIEGIFEKRLGGRGFGLHEMAVLVAVIEDSIFQDAQARLVQTFKALGFPIEVALPISQMSVVVEVYMSAFIMKTDLSTATAEFLYQQRNDMAYTYPTWPKLQSWLRELHKRNLPWTHIDQSFDRQNASLQDISAIVREVVSTFGTFHGRQCQGLKTILTGMQHEGSAGCLNLADFYQKGLKADSNWLFVETPEYLRRVGVLDESDQKNPRLITANYINSPTNCLDSGYYMVCCHNECEDIFSNLERQLGRPSATAIEIVIALKGMGTSALRANMMPPALRRRLEDIAGIHGGQVPIHGRLFSQWLHHVYPNECPYPHLSGQKKLQWMEDFEKETGHVSQWTETEIASFVNTTGVAPLQSARNTNVDVGSCVPWQNEEELLTPMPHWAPLHALEEDPHVKNLSAAVGFFAAISTFMIAMLQYYRSIVKFKYQPKMILV